MKEELIMKKNMLYIKMYSGFIFSFVIGLLLYEEANYAYTYKELAEKSFKNNK